MNATESHLVRRSLEPPAVNPTASTALMVSLLAPLLRRVARRYERDAPSCHDLQQEMLIAIWLSFDSYEKRTSFRNWVHAIADEVGAQHVARRNVSHHAERLDDNLESVPNSHDTESIVATRERASTVLSLLNGLRPREREAVLLDLQEFELREMGEAMHISSAQARDTLVRAKRRLLLWMRRIECDTTPLSPEMEGDAEEFPSVYHIERDRR